MSSFRLLGHLQLLSHFLHIFFWARNVDSSTKGVRALQLLCLVSFANLLGLCNNTIVTLELLFLPNRCCTVYFLIYDIIFVRIPNRLLGDYTTDLVNSKLLNKACV